MSELQRIIKQSFDRYLRVKNGERIEIVYDADYWTAFNRLENDQAILANAYIRFTHDYDWNIYAEIGGDEPLQVEMKTRGDLRRLCKGLKIELKEKYGTST